MQPSHWLLLGTLYRGSNSMPSRKGLRTLSIKITLQSCLVSILHTEQVLPSDLTGFRPNSSPACSFFYTFLLSLDHWPPKGKIESYFSNLEKFFKEFRCGIFFLYLIRCIFLFLNAGFRHFYLLLPACCYENEQKQFFTWKIANPTLSYLCDCQNIF